VIDTMQVEPVLKNFIEKDGVKVVAADYALDSGVVTFLDEIVQSVGPSPGHTRGPGF
jgi:hypothetical protein